MDFRFNVNNLLPKKINKITHTLIPEGFRGDRREYNECQRLLTRILDDMGEASAKAQGLNRTITSALKLRDTDHIIYLMIDSEGNNGLGSVVGLLKTGSKSLFMFDENGLHYQLKPRCILDFYIHESRQRTGLGNELYQYMLTEENIKPIKLAIDRPSDKFLAFLKKHYGFTSIIPQNNKFVVFRGFFDDEIQESSSNNRYNNSSPSPNRQSAEHRNTPNHSAGRHSSENDSINGTSVTRSAYGRYAASRPPCSMANIIHNTGIAEHSKENTRYVARAKSAGAQFRKRPGSLDLSHEQECTDNLENLKTSIEVDAVLEKQMIEIENISLRDSLNEKDVFQIEESNVLSFNDEIQPEDSMSETNHKDSKEEVTEEVANEQSSGGHLDLKFYHSPLW